MEKILITIGSVTTASRFARVMERRAGKHASVVQTPSELNTGGCSYSVKINESDIEDAKKYKRASISSRSRKNNNRNKTAVSNDAVS